MERPNAFARWHRTLIHLHLIYISFRRETEHTHTQRKASTIKLTPFAGHLASRKIPLGTLPYGIATNAVVSIEMQQHCSL